MLVIMPSVTSTSFESAVSNVPDTPPLVNAATAKLTIFPTEKFLVMFAPDSPSNCVPSKLSLTVTVPALGNL